MAQIFAISASWKDFPRQFAKLARYYPVRHVPISKFDPEKHDESALLLIDFHNLTPGQLRDLKPFTRQRNDAAVGLVTIRSRKQVLQARELGIFHLIDREDRFSNLLLKLRELLGDYSKPKLPAGLPEKTVRTVHNTSATLNQMSLAALSGAELPVRKLAGSAVELSATLDADGLDSWLTAVQSHHSHTYCHTMMVAGHALTFSKALGMSQKEQYLMGLGGLVHDL